MGLRVPSEADETGVAEVCLKPGQKLCTEGNEDRVGGGAGSPRRDGRGLSRRAGAVPRCMLWCCGVGNPGEGLRRGAEGWVSWVLGRKDGDGVLEFAL